MKKFYITLIVIILVLFACTFVGCNDGCTECPDDRGAVKQPKKKTGIAVFNLKTLSIERR